MELCVRVCVCVCVYCVCVCVCVCVWLGYHLGGYWWCGAHLPYQRTAQDFWWGGSEKVGKTRCTWGVGIHTTLHMYIHVHVPTYTCILWRESIPTCIIMCPDTHTCTCRLWHFSTFLKCFIKCTCTCTRTSYFSPLQIFTTLLMITHKNHEECMMYAVPFTYIPTYMYIHYPWKSSIAGLP